MLEHGISQHEGYISEPTYILAYMEFLVQRREEENLRVLFERVLDPSVAMPKKLARYVMSCDVIPIHVIFSVHPRFSPRKIKMPEKEVK